MSSASTPSAAPSTAPGHVAPPPLIVPTAPRRPRWTRLWVLGVALTVIVAVVAWTARHRVAESARMAPAVTRTAPITLGEVHRTIRVTGTIQAERFAALMVPQVRGSRSDRGRTFGGGGGGGGGGAAAATSSNSSSSSSAGGSTASTASGSGSSLGPTRGTTNRFSDMSGSSTKGNSVSARATTSGSVGSANLGSTASSLVNPGGGGGGGMSDFMMVLMKCVPAGSRVKAGDPVAEFDRQYQLIRLEDYKASLIQHEANIKKLRADQAVARHAYDQSVKSSMGDWARANVDLQTTAVRSAIEAEQLRLSEQEMAAAYKEARGELKNFNESQRAALRNSELDRDQARIELQRAQNNVDRMVMKAPIDGIAVMQTIYRGGDFGQVQQGDQVYSGQTFMTVVDPSSMVLSATVNQVDSEALRVGMKATVHLDAYPGLAVPATVMAVGAMTNAGGWRASWVREVPIRLRLEQKDPRIIPDLSGSADIELAAEKQVAVAPLEAIFRDGSDARPYVFVQGPDGFEKREVELGLASNVAVAVRSGLRRGEMVALMHPLSERRP